MSQAEKIAAHPATARTLKVFVRDLVLSARIGVYQHEKLASQRVRINLELTCAEHPAIQDELDNVVNYAEIVARIRDIVAAGHIHLVETLADRVAQACFDDRRVLSARVRIEKLDVFKEAESVGVEIERYRDTVGRESTAWNPR
ncbi:MAG TPA: dihydroneopterin aldolase [Candidatus Binatia bacterium]|nr:dihydroneopterin aldolase [Candidatus Binatia bacterium]